MKKKQYILGVHFGHDSTIALIKDSQLVEAMSEERLSRQKKHAGFPFLTFEYVKEKYSLLDSDIEHVYFVGEDPGRYDSIFLNKEDNKKMREAYGGASFFKRAFVSYFSIPRTLLRARDSFLVFRIRFGLKKRFWLF